jgi:hypothetical protein
MAEDVATVAATFEGFNDQFASVVATLEPLLQRPLKEVLAELGAENHEGGARLHASLAYALDALFFMLLRAQGVDPAADAEADDSEKGGGGPHAIMNELRRVKTYIKKVSDAAAGKTPDTTKAAKFATQKPPRRLDGGAASRFVKGALAGNGGDDGGNGKARGGGGGKRRRGGGGGGGGGRGGGAARGAKKAKR